MLMFFQGILLRETSWIEKLKIVKNVKNHRETEVESLFSTYLELFMVYHRGQYLSLNTCCSTYIIGICFLRAIGLTLQMLLMIPLLTNVSVRLISEWFSFNNLKANASEWYLFIFLINLFPCFSNHQRFHQWKQQLWEIIRNTYRQLLFIRASYK